MPTITVRPSSTEWNLDAAIVGAATAQAATSDDSDASYVELSNVAESFIQLGCTAVSLPAGGVWKSVRARARVKSSGSGAPFTMGVGYGTGTAAFGAFATGSFAEVSTPLVSLSSGSPSPRCAANALSTSPPGTIQIAEFYFDAIYAAQPTVAVTSPTGTVTDTTKPAAQWTHTAGADGGSQSAAQVRIYNAAQYGTSGFNPDFSTPFWGTDIVGSANSVTPGVQLVDDNYRVYVRTAQSVNGSNHWSSWDFEAFTISTSPPVAPTIAVTPQDDKARNRLVVATGESLLRLDGTTGCYVSTPDAASLDLTGDITIVTYVAADDWTPAAQGRPLSKLSGPTGYYIQVGTTGALEFGFGNGTAFRSMTSTAPGLTDGQGYWLEFFYDDTAKTCRFRKSSDPVTTPRTSISWTTISTSAPHAGGSPAAGVGALTVGSDPTGSVPFIGTAHKAYVIDGDPTGTVVASPDFTGRAPSTTAFTDDQGNTWTLNGTATIELDPTTEWYLQVQRSSDFGANWTTVRGASRIEVVGSTWVGYDHETAGNGATTAYRAQAIRPTINGDIASAWSSTATSTWTSLDVWLKDPERPSRNRIITLMDPAPQPVRPVRKTDHDIIGRATPIPVSDVRGSARGTLQIETYDLAEQAAIITLFDDAPVLLLQTPAEFGLGSLYISPGDLQENLPTTQLVQPWRAWPVPYVVVDEPADAGITALGGITLDDFGALYTYPADIPAGLTFDDMV